MKKTNCNCGLLSCEAVNKRDKDKKFVLVSLPYKEDALEPLISAKTLQYHYGKHLVAYIDNTNKQKAGTEFEDLPLYEIIQKATGGLFNNAAQVFNHYFYFEALHAPSTELPQTKMLQLINKNFGNFETFKEKFTQAGTTLFGSGWVWLVQDGEKLEIIALPNAGTPIQEGKYPLLTMDVWEHAYYLDTQNARPKYIENFWKLVNWDVVEQRIR